MCWSICFSPGADVLILLCDIFRGKTWLTPDMLVRVAPQIMDSVRSRLRSFPTPFF